MAKITRDLLIAAEQAGVKLEIVGGLPTWEAFPAPRHQKAVDRIRQKIHRIEQTIKPSANDSFCGCYHYADIYIRFPDGSLKRPDISIFCKELEDSDEAVEVVPEAVIEVVSKGYESKDAEIGRLFYLAQGVKDVVVYDPATDYVIHARRDGAKRLISPVAIALECGCEATV
jgi:Uma2 family endonuclease